MNDNSTLPSGVDLKELFDERHIFESTRKLRHAGFGIVRSSENERVTVVSHPDVPKYLFKKFLEDVSHSYEKQLYSYKRRVGGARELKAHLTSLAIKDIVVPQKWLCELPSRFSRRGKSGHIVMVEKCSIHDRDQSRQFYRTITEEMLRHLCTIFFVFKQVDFSAANMPFTSDGKIAFIDTGYLTRITEESARWENYKKNIDKLYSDESRAFANSLWNELERQRDVLLKIPR